MSRRAWMPVRTPKRGYTRDGGRKSGGSSKVRRKTYRNDCAKMGKR